MKKNILFSSLLLWGTMLQAQDVIVKKDGTTILSKVLEVNQSNVKYRKYSNQTGPIYTINKSDLLSINYENGDKDTFSNATNKHKDMQTTTSSSSSRYIEKLPDENNTSIIAQYNKLVSFKDETSKKEASIFALKYGISNESILSNKDIEIKLELVKLGVCCQYVINVHNKTNKVIYIDLGNTFKVEQDGKSSIYFDNSEQTTISQGNASGIGLGLGSVASALGVGGIAGTLANGVSIGGGKQHSVSTTYSQQRILAIAPQATQSLSLHKEVQVNKKKTECISHGEQFFRKIPSLQKGFINKGENHTFSESESPDKIRYYITYSTEETFSSYSTISFGLYLQQIYGSKCVHDCFWYKCKTVDSFEKK